ncbi:MAG: Uncharacterized protein G01um101420_973 [Parcubacteria group bacterium Gr01-1014_20]|nr:MAG: Uncharacterized protein G01um101420_973 [Parcubacteria group bacterium Gr01-1014_20]
MILAVGWLGLSFIKIKLHDNIVNKEVWELEAKADNLEHSNSMLEKFLSYMTNPSFLERQARLKLNYKAPGEEVVFVYTDNSANISSSSQDFKNENIPNPVKWWYYLMEE